MVCDADFLWDRLFTDVADRHAPIKFRRAKGIKNPWITSKLIEMRGDREHHLKKANSAYHWSMYRKLRKCVNREERSLKYKYYCQLIEESKNDGSKMWRAIKEVLPKKELPEVFSIFDKGTLYTDSLSVLCFSR